MVFTKTTKNKSEHVTMFLTYRFYGEVNWFFSGFILFNNLIFNNLNLIIY